MIVEAVGYDIPIPGYKSRNTNILRLFKSEVIEWADFMPEMRTPHDKLSKFL